MRKDKLLHYTDIVKKEREQHVYASSSRTNCF